MHIYSRVSKLNAFIQLEGEAIGTSYAANDTTRDALAAKVKGNEWMIYTDLQTGTAYWDFVSSRQS